tara:strand:- start:21152 stop:21970 length:819 start_codon:yes stop_codon:yes gene_type:complete
MFSHAQRPMVFGGSIGVNLWMVLLAGCLGSLAHPRLVHADVSLEFTVDIGPGGVSYRWDAFDRFDPARMLQFFDVSSPTGSSLGESFDNYMDFRTAVEGEWTFAAEFQTDPSESLTFDVSGLPMEFPTAPPVVLTPVEGETIASGQAFFPVLDPASIDPATMGGNGFLSRYRLSVQDAVASFETGGTNDGFLVTLNPGISQTDFGFGYSNVLFADGLESNLIGDTQLFGGITYWASSPTRTVSIVAVPEPSSLIALTLLGMAGTLRRRRSRC